MKIILIKGDITAIAADAIVNAANTSLMGGGGVDGAIHRKGGKAILDDCIKIKNKQGGYKVGEVVYTTAGNLPAKFVIHTVGPVWNGGNSYEYDLLSNCYFNALKLANELGVKTIAFPNISTGIYRFPKKEAACIAIGKVTEFKLMNNPHIEKVFFVCFDDENYQIYQSLLE